ncbi:MAG: hypothetical protein H6737_14260 [Alphaproteobacteria bacterium]|nr:hypothetical protein [Alphaproteobacteria bacterium]
MLILSLLLANAAPGADPATSASQSAASADLIALLLPLTPEERVQTLRARVEAAEGMDAIRLLAALDVVETLADRDVDPVRLRVFLSGATSDDPTVREATQAEVKRWAGTAAPVSAPQASPEPVAPSVPTATARSGDIEALKSYKAKYLRIGTRTIHETGVVNAPGTNVSTAYSITRDTWGVYTAAAGSRPLGTLEFLDLVDPAESKALEARWRKRQTTWQWIGLGSLGAGATLFAGGLGLALKPGLTDAEGSAAAGLIVVGSVATIGSLWPISYSFRKLSKRLPDQHFENTEAARYVDAYNDGLRQELGLSEVDVVAFE